jgi:hypothetical protein
MDRILASICPAYTWYRSEPFICSVLDALLLSSLNNKIVKRFFVAYILFTCSLFATGILQVQAQPINTTVEFKQPFNNQHQSTDLYARLEAGSELRLAAKVFLQGPYRGGLTMTPGLHQYLQAYTASSPASPDSLIGRMSASFNVPSDAIDVLKIELRHFNDKAITAASRYAWLMADGSLRDFETGQLPYLTFSSGVNSSDSYHVVVKHRNHLTIMSSVNEPVKLVNDTPGSNPSEGFIDFTDIRNIYGAGAIFIGEPGYAMVAGNARNNDQEINANDFYDVSEDSDSPVDTGYKPTDYTLDGKCNATDFQLSSEANDRLYSSTAINP